MIGAVKTFVIRVFVPAEPEPGDSGLHGFVEEIGSGRQSSFQHA